MNTNSIDTAAAESLRSFAVANNELQFAHLVTAALAGEAWAVERLDTVTVEIARYGGIDSPLSSKATNTRVVLRIIRKTDTTRPDGATPRGFAV